MDNRKVPQPLTCTVCGEVFYGRKDALTCSPKCRKKRQYYKDKEVYSGE